MSVILLNGLWQGAVIAAVAAAITMLLPRGHAATRYAVWYASLLSLVIVPLLGLLQRAPAFAVLPASVERTAAATSTATAQAASSSGTLIVALWLAGVAFCLVRLALSYLRIDRIIRNATPAPQFGSYVLTSKDIALPIAARIFSPVIVIPTDLAETLERPDLDSIVQHESAHIRRFDTLGNLIQRIVEACLFFNPWVYLIGRQLISEREAACDDWAVEVTGEPDRYASCLAQLALGAPRSRAPLLTPSAIGSKRMLVGRIARLLNGKGIQLKVNYVVLAASLAAFAMLAILLQTSNGLASDLPANCYHEAKVIDAAPPDIPKADYRPHLTTNALVTIDPSGKPVSAKIVQSSGNAAMDQATIKAAMSSTYAPEMTNCKPKTGSYLFHVETGP